MTTEYTTNRGYPKPDFDTRSWHDQMHTSMDMIDADMQSVTRGATPSPWVNNHPYIVDNLAVDSSSQIIYLCLIAHTSATAGTFAADRAAHPTFWLSQGTPFTNTSYQWTAIQEFLGGWTTGATGGNKGANTWNAGTFYENGVSIATKYVAKAGDTMTGNLGIAPAAGGAALVLNHIAAGQQANIIFQRSSTTKWQIGKDLNDIFYLYDTVSASFVITAQSNGTSVNFSRNVILPADPTASLGAATKQYVDAVKAYVDARAPGGYRNALRRNGGFEIWQRTGGVINNGIGSGGAPVYTVDGWYVSAAVAQITNVVAVAGLTNGSQLAATVRRLSGQSVVSVEIFGFPLDTDEIFPLLGQFVTVSFTAKAGANWSPASGTLSVNVVCGTGAPAKAVAGYTTTFYVASGNANLTGAPTRYQFTSGVVVPINTRQMEVYFSWIPVGTSGADDSFTVDDVQLEIVPDALQVASAFERLNFTEQLLLCQRYFQKTFEYATAPANAVGTNKGELYWGTPIAGAAVSQFQWRFSVPMRSVPTCALYNPVSATAQIRNITAAADLTGSGYAAATGMMTAFGTQTAGMTAGQVLGVNAIADAGI